MNWSTYYSRKYLEPAVIRVLYRLQIFLLNRKKLTTLHDDDKNDHKLFCQVSNKLFG